MNVLVTGATGFVGSSLVPALVSAGHTVTAMTRDASSYDPPDGASVTECDLLTLKTLEGSFESANIAYYLVHSLQTGEAFAQRDREAARNFVRAASEAESSASSTSAGLEKQEANSPSTFAHDVRLNRFSTRMSTN